MTSSSVANWLGGIASLRTLADMVVIKINGSKPVLEGVLKNPKGIQKNYKRSESSDLCFEESKLVLY